MRARPWLLFAIPLMLLASGCVDSVRDVLPGASDASESASLQSSSTETRGTTDQAVLPTNEPSAGPRLAPIAVALTTTGSQWIEPGTLYPVSAAAPGVSGASFLWATGPLPAAARTEMASLDTKEIAPGASKSLKFQQAGVYGIHCHPHPFMTLNLTVVEGLQGPSQVAVDILDGESPGEYRFAPDALVVGAGTEIVFTNRGALPHTATLGSQEPPLVLSKLAGASGDISVSGDGWARVVAIARDPSGRVGMAEVPVYVRPLPAALREKMSGDFLAAALSTGEAVDPGPAQSKNFDLRYGGALFLNFTAADSTGTGAVSVQVLDKDGREVLALPSGAAGGSSVLVDAGKHTVVVTPTSGVQIQYEVTIDVGYHPVPPPPAPPVEEAGGGAHAGH